MKIVFAGTPEFAVPSLRAAMRHGEVRAVYTQPDRPAGRGRQPQPSPVKLAALGYGLPVLQPHSLRGEEARAQLAAFAPDVMIVVAYGLLLPQQILDVPEAGCWNAHASLLPRWRGAAPIQRAIEAGDTETGVCLMQMEKGLDTGPVLLRFKTEIADNESAGQLHDRLAEIAAQVVSDGLALLRAGIRIKSLPQSTEGVVYARKLEKTESALDFTQPAEVLARKVRAFHPWPITEMQLQGERIRVHAAQALPLEHSHVPGCVLHAGVQGIDIACGKGALRITQLQRDGGKVISASDWVNAQRAKA